MIVAQWKNGRHQFFADDASLDMQGNMGERDLPLPSIISEDEKFESTI